MVADAAEAADDEPRASMIAAPRLATVGMKVFSSQSWSSTTSAALRPADLGVEQVGVLGRRVVAPDRHLLDVGDRGAGLRRRAARSRGCGRAGSAPRSAPAGCRARCVIAIRALVLAGLPVTPMRTSSAATVVEGLALGGEDRAVRLEQVAALHARAARAGADQQGEVDAVEDLLRVGADLRRRPASGTRSRRAP